MWKHMQHMPQMLGLIRLNNRSPGHHPLRKSKTASMMPLANNRAELAVGRCDSELSVLLVMTTAEVTS